MHIHFLSMAEKSILQKFLMLFTAVRKGKYCKYHLSISFLPPQSKIEMAHVLGVQLVAYPFFVHGRKKYFAKIFDTFTAAGKEDIVNIICQIPFCLLKAK